jgi:hypothetical protein
VRDDSLVRHLRRLGFHFDGFFKTEPVRCDLRRLFSHTLSPTPTIDLISS